MRHDYVHGLDNVLWFRDGASLFLIKMAVCRKACKYARWRYSRVLLTVWVCVQNRSLGPKIWKVGCCPSWEKVPLPGHRLPLFEGPASMAIRDPLPHTSCLGSRAPILRTPRTKKAAFSLSHPGSQSLMFSAQFKVYLETLSRIQILASPDLSNITIPHLTGLRPQQTPFHCAGLKDFPLIFFTFVFPHPG